MDNANIMNIDPLGYAEGIKNKSAVNGSSVEPFDRIYLWLLHLATPICVTKLMKSDVYGAAANTTKVCTGVILLEALLIRDANHYDLSVMITIFCSHYAYYAA